MAGIRLMVIQCVLLMLSEKELQKVIFAVFIMSSKYLHSKKLYQQERVLISNFLVSFFSVVTWYPLLKSGDIELKPGTIMLYACMKKELEIEDNRMQILHKNAKRTTSFIKKTLSKHWLQSHRCF